MMVDVRPWPKAFRPPPPPPQDGQQAAEQAAAEQAAAQQADGGGGEDGGAAAVVDPAAQPRCLYFIGLSKKRVRRNEAAHACAMCLPVPAPCSS